MAEILLANPRRRRRKTSTRKRRRNPSRRRAPVARKKTTRRRRRRNPIPPGASRKRYRRRRRSNPTAPRLNARALQGFATAAGKGAAGAIALDVALSYLPLPATLKTGIAGKVTKGLGAIVLGMVANKTKLVSASTARDMTVGALTVQFTGIGRDLLAQFAPGIALNAYVGEDGLGYAGSGWNPSYEYESLGAYNVGSGHSIAAPGYSQPGFDGGYSELAMYDSSY